MKQTIQAYWLWWNVTLTHTTLSDRVRRTVRHAMGKAPCTQRGQISSYCPCYWRSPWLDRVYL